MSRGISIMNWMRAEPVERSIERAAKAGYTHISITGDPDVDPDRVRAALDEHGIGCWGSVTIMGGGRDLTHADRYIRRATVDYAKDTVAFAARVGGSVVGVTPAVGKLEPVSGAAQEWRWLVEGFREVQAFAGEQGIRVGIECLNRYESYLCNTSESGVEIANEIGDGFGVILDMFHMNIEEPDICAAIRRVGPLLVDFQVADSNRRPPGQGSLDWGSALKELDTVGYSGCLTGEFYYTPDLSEAQYDDDVVAAITFLRGCQAEVDGQR